jgi:hypothetical protein
MCAQNPEAECTFISTLCSKNPEAECTVMSALCTRNLEAKCKDINTLCAYDPKQYAQSPVHLQIYKYSCVFEILRQNAKSEVLCVLEILKQNA